MDRYNDYKYIIAARMILFLAVLNIKIVNGYNYTFYDCFVLGESLYEIS